MIRNIQLFVQAKGKLSIHFLFIVIPIIYVLTGFYMNNLVGPYFTRSVDSEYIYFISGLSLAQGKFMIGHIDNPAAPLQYLVALVFKVVYLLRSPEISFAEDAILNSELYLKIANLFYLIIIASSLYGISLYAYKHLKNYSLTILIQTAPFISELTIDNLPRFAPETFLIIPILLLMIVTIRYINRQFHLKEKELARIFGMIIGFGLSIKLTFLPLLILPLFLLKKHKVRFILIVILTFLIVAVPVTLQIDRFYFWIKKLILHSGQHGKGSQSFIEINAFIQNLKYLFNANKFFFYGIFLFAISLISLVYKKKDQKIFRVNIAIGFILIGTLFMVGRNFEYRYFIMALYLFPLIVFLCAKNISSLFNFKYSKHIKHSLFIAICFIFIFHQINKIPGKTKHIESLVSANDKTQCFIKNLPKDKLLIISSNYSGNAFKEYAMMFTGAYAGSKPNKLYKPLLNKIYPNSILYHNWDRTFHQWLGNYEMMKDCNEFYIYLHHIKFKDQLFNDLKPYFNEKTELFEELIFLNDKNNNAVLRIKTI